jgi:hypothetical protein
MKMLVRKPRDKQNGGGSKGIRRRSPCLPPAKPDGAGKPSLA